MKEQVLESLEAARGREISGGELARTLGVTRSAVWKAVRSLQAAGHTIDAVPGRGYRLSARDDIITAAAVNASLHTSSLGRALYVLDEVDSTNTYAKKLAQDGAAHGTVVISNRQSAGRGRLSRSFYSPADSGLYMSVILRLPLALEDAVRVTCAAAVATARAVSMLGAGECGIKWVNDLYIGGRKVCGILSEAGIGLETRGLDYLVVGIGVNIRVPEDGFPQDLTGIAGALSADRPPLRAELAARILDELEQIAQALPAAGFMEEYRRRSIVVGREITVHGASGPAWRATALSITDEGRLVVRMADTGEEESLQTGEIGIKLDKTEDDVNGE